MTGGFVVWIVGFFGSWLRWSVGRVLMFGNPEIEISKEVVVNNLSFFCMSFDDSGEIAKSRDQSVDCSFS